MTGSFGVSFGLALHWHQGGARWGEQRAGAPGSQLQQRRLWSWVMGPEIRATGVGERDTRWNFYLEVSPDYPSLRSL